jgi:multiple sugar transport system permease protein
MKMAKHIKILENLALLIAISVGLVVLVFPVYYTIISSFKSEGGVRAWPPGLIPFVDFQPDWIGWDDIFFGGIFHGYGGRSVLAEVLSALTNSLVVAITAAVLALIIGSFAAYSLTRFRFYKFGGNIGISGWFLSQYLLPGIVLVIPYYYMFNTLGMLDTWWALILIYTNTNIPFVVWLMREYFKALPIEIEEAALIDGASLPTAIFRVLFPMSAPALTSVFFLAFIGAWNEFLFALILTYQKATTLTVVLAGMSSRIGTFWYDLFATATLSILPTLCVAFIIQRWIIRGLTLGAVKG